MNWDINGTVHAESSRRRCVGRSFTALAVAIVVATVANGACVVPDCETEIHTEAVSPDGTTKATAYELGCGVLERRNTRVTIHPVTTLANDGERVLSTDGRYGVHLEWATSNSLRVTVDCHGDCDRRIGSAHIRKSRVGDVSVEYVYSGKLRATLDPK